jgi:hypothetical protein
MGTDPKKFQPYSDGNLINGKPGPTNTSQVATRTKIGFRTGARHLLRLVNTGAAGQQQVTIDGHVMTVVANDFVPIHPYQTKVVTLSVSLRQPCMLLHRLIML